MRIALTSGPLAILAATLLSSSASAARDAERNVAAADGSLPRLANLKDAYIVLFKDASSARSSALSGRAEDHHANFYEHLQKRKAGGVPHKIRYSWSESDVISGVSIQLKHSSDVGALYNAPGVEGVYPVEQFRSPTFQGERASEDAVKSACKKDTFAPHVMTQVDRLHKEGHYGKGIKVAVLDTGIDYTHPALNGGLPAGQRCYGQPQCQVIGGYDFAGDAYSDGTTDAVPDNDPFADCPGSMHGTHVAGTIIANDTTLGFTGVVPQAKLAMYRVFGCGLSATSTDMLIAGMSRALVEGADVISISIGGPDGWAASAASVVASRISKLGVPVVVAAGNSGTSGAFYSSSPGNSEFGLNIGAVQNEALLGFAAKVTGVSDLPEIFALTSKAYTFPSNQTTTLPLYATSKTPVLDDACSPLPANLNLDGKVTLVLRGACSPSVKQKNVLDRGGKYIIVANAAPPLSVQYSGPLNDQQQSISVTYAEAIKLQAAFAAGKDVKITFDVAAPFESRPNKVDGSLITSFSNFGPTGEMLFAPHVSAPGGNILSTYPIALGSYGIISGTSMAAPFFAGVVAQYIAINGKTASVKIRSRLMSHSKPLHDSKDASSPLSSAGRAGAGLVQAYDAIFATASAQPAQLALNDSVYFQSEHWITIKNIGKKVEKFTTTHLPAGTAQTANTTVPGYTAFNLFPVPVSKQYASVVVAPAAFTLAPGASRKVKVTVTPPRKNQHVLPVYSGYIKFTSSTKRSSLSVPYLGLAASISKVPVLDATNQYTKTYALPALNNNAGEPFTGEPTVDLSSETSAPLLTYRLTFGTPKVHIALVAADVDFSATIKHNKVAARSLVVPGEHLVHRRMHHHSHLQEQRDVDELAVEVKANVTASQKSVALFSDVVTVGTISETPYLPRNSEDPGSFTSSLISDELIKPDGSTFTAAEGRYRVLLRVQRGFLDPKLASSYDSWLSEPFTYRKAS